jgi:hypothetical protein
MEKYVYNDWNNKNIHLVNVSNRRDFSPKIQSMIDMPLLKKTIECGISVLMDEEISLYENQYAGFKIFAISISFIDMGPNLLAKPFIYEIINVCKPFNNLATPEENIVKFSYLLKNIIYPHFGITRYPQFEYTKNSNDGILSKYYDIIIHLNLEMKGNNFDIYYKEAIIGKVELNIIQSEIEMKHIEIEAPHRKKGIATAAIAYIMEILAARYAPVNPFIYFISDERVNTIAVRLHFYKYGDNFKRLCRIFNYF